MKIVNRLEQLKCDTETTSNRPFDIARIKAFMSSARNVLAPRDTGTKCHFCSHSRALGVLTARSWPIIRQNLFPRPVSEKYRAIVRKFGVANSWPLRWGSRHNLWHVLWWEVLGAGVLRSSRRMNSCDENFVPGTARNEVSAEYQTPTHFAKVTL